MSKKINSSFDPNTDVFLSDSKPLIKNTKKTSPNSNQTTETTNTNKTNRFQSSENNNKPKKKKHLFLRGLGIALGIGSVVAADVAIALLVTNYMGKTTGDINVTFVLGSHGLSFTGPTTVKVNKGTKFADTPRPTPVAETDYMFDSWSISEDTIINNDITITANFVEAYPITDKEFTVMFALSNERAGVISGQTTMKVNGNQTFKSINKPYVQANKGYRFTGWDWDENARITSNTIVYAQFEEYTPSYKTPITITFNPGENGNFTGYIPPIITVDAGTTFREINKPNVLPNTGYYFNGWADSDGNAITESTILSSNIQIIAQYTNQKPGEALFTVLFNPGLHGAFSAGETYSQVYEGTLFGNVNKPAVSAYTGYTFIGWNINENTPIKSARVATAQYIVNPLSPIPEEMQVTIKFEAGEHGSLPAITEQIVQSGTRFDQLNLPYATPDNGYMFNGWYVDEDKISDDTEICANITLTAQFVAISTTTTYNITFNPGSCGQLDPAFSPSPVYEGQTLADVNHPKIIPNDGYTFVGWDTPRTTVVSSDLTVTAKYVKTPVIGDYITLTFDAGQNGYINGQNTAYCLKNVLFASINTPAVVAKPGYRFTGWSMSATETLVESVKIEAQYTQDESTADKLVVTYDSGKYGYFEDGVTKWYELTDKDTPILELAKPTVYCYASKKFDGWDKQDSETITQDTTITATYDNRNPLATLCLVVFEPGEHGSLSGPLYQVVESGTTVQKISKPVVYPYSNYSFVGWDKASTEIITGDTTLVAQYEQRSQKEYKIALIQPEASTNWSLSSSVAKAKYNTDVKITASKTAGQTSEQVPYSISVNADGVIKNYDLTKESDDTYSVTFKMLYSSDITVSLNFKTAHPTDKIYSTINSIDYVYDLDNLCSNNEIVLTNFSDPSKQITATRAEFNYQLIFPANLADFNKSNFLINCTSFNQPIDMSKCSEISEIPTAFMSGCSSFNSEIKLPPSTKLIGEKFMQDCTKFNQTIDLSNISYFGEDFMINCVEFNQPIDLSGSHFICDSFMFNCSKFNQDLVIPSTLEILVDNFMVNCDSMTSTITFNCDEEVIGHSNHSLGSSNSEAACVKTGIKIAGPHASYVVADGFPSGTFESYIHRKTYQ